MVLLGLAILVVSLLPAFVARRRLEASEKRLAAEVKQMQEDAARINRERQAIGSDLFVLDKAVRELMAPGRRTAGGSNP